MRSETLWLTDLGLTQIGSGEISPGLDPIELRFNPAYGHHLDEWEFEVGTLKGKHSVQLLDKSFNEEEKFFSFKLQFTEMQSPTTLQVLARHVRTDLVKVLWEGDILPNTLHLTNKFVGLSDRNWSVIEEFKKVYHNADLRHFKIPRIEVLIPSDTIIAASAKSELEHTEENAPLVFKGFHPHQDFHVEVNGFVFGYGGKGGDAGYSTITERDVDVIYPTDGLDGGNTVYVEHPTQVVHVEVSRYGCFLPGMGGKGATGFSINSPSKRLNQVGHPGVGGYPNGLNGSLTPVHYKLDLVKTNNPPKINSFGNKYLNYVFKEAEYVGHDLPVFVSNNSCIKATENGKQGLVAPKGVVSLNNKRTKPFVHQLIHAYGAYIEV